MNWVISSVNVLWEKNWSGSLAITDPNNFEQPAAYLWRGLIYIEYTTHIACVCSFAWPLDMLLLIEGNIKTRAFFKYNMWSSTRNCVYAVLFLVSRPIRLFAYINSVYIFNKKGGRIFDIYGRFKSQCQFKLNKLQVSSMETLVSGSFEQSSRSRKPP
jgi:hypothetical protein